MSSLPFPPGLSFAVRDTSRPGELTLTPAAAALAAGMKGPRRKTEFTLGRLAAAEALRNLGTILSQEDLGRDQIGAPLWPGGTIGAIAHTTVDGISTGAALVAERFRYTAVGLDIEGAHRPVSADAFERVGDHEERLSLEQVPNGALLLFSAKETVYKALAPIVGRKFWFGDVRLLWDTHAGRFTGTLVHSLHSTLPSGTKVEVEAARLGPLAVTWMAVPRHERQE